MHLTYVVFLNKQMDEAESLDGRRREDSLLSMLTETIRELEAVRRLRDHHNGAMYGRCVREEPGRGGGDGVEEGSGEGRLSAAEGEKEGEKRGASADEEEKECMQKVLGVLRELSVSHSDRVTAWRGALRECADMLAKPPPGSSDQQHPSTTGI